VSAPYPPQPQPGSAGAAPNNTLGLIAMIVGIASIPLACCFGAGTVLGIIAVILGYMGKGKAEKGEATNGGQARAGLICGFVGIGIGILWFIFVFSLNVITLPMGTN
jgi:hypothetical protein